MFSNKISWWLLWNERTSEAASIDCSEKFLRRHCNKATPARVLLRIFQNFSEQIFYKTPASSLYSVTIFAKKLHHRYLIEPYRRPWSALRENWPYSKFSIPYFPAFELNVSSLKTPELQFFKNCDFPRAL